MMAKGVEKAPAPLRTLQRLLAKTDRSEGSEGCWVWLGQVNDSGYAIVHTMWGSRKAHVVIWELIHGVVPEGKQIHHECRRRHCINPKHLVLRDASEHLLEHAGEANASKKTCKRGHSLDDEENTQIVRDAGGKIVERRCRACLRERVARHRKKKRLAEETGLDYTSPR